MREEPVHYPVMRKEVLDAFPAGDKARKASMIDCTLGEGGHTSLLLGEYPALVVTGLDRDSGILEKARRRLVPFKGRFVAVNAWFDDYLGNHELGTEDFILFDLGISMYHYAESGRGFGFRKDERLDMRLDATAPLSAYEVVNRYPEDDLCAVIHNYGEERFARRIARAIATERRRRPIETTAELEGVVYMAVPPSCRHSRIHPATRTFQAIRIEVNRELDRIEPALDAAIGCLKPGGRIAVISFHSLEDRLAKQTFRKHLEGDRPDIKLVNKKPFVPSEDEVAENPPSRSAKLRIVEKLGV